MDVVRQKCLTDAPEGSDRQHCLPSNTIRIRPPCGVSSGIVLLMNHSALRSQGGVPRLNLSPKIFELQA